MTHEYLNGQKVNLPQPFRSYNSPKEAVDDYVNFLKNNKRYEKAGVFQAKTSGEYFGALQKAGYATDPNYAAKLTSATEGTARKTAQLQMPSPSTGVQVASASTSMSDQRMAAMAPSGGNTVIFSISDILDKNNKYLLKVQRYKKSNIDEYIELYSKNYKRDYIELLQQNCPEVYYTGKLLISKENDKLKHILQIKSNKRTKKREWTQDIRNYINST